VTDEDVRDDGGDSTPSLRCPRCEGLLIGDAAADELVCFACSRRFKADGTTTARDHENPGRNHERIGGMRF
jgi:DNA-directed RNA polymerase subunit RPC12/RpoP